MKHTQIVLNEAVGNPECPIMYRTVIAIGGYSLRLHRFTPNHHDQTPHDHPWSFITLVIWGGYQNIDLSGDVEWLRMGSIRLRRAEHAHTTVTGPRGCITVIITGRLRHPGWGFWLGKEFYTSELYRAIFKRGAPCSPLRRNKGSG